MCQKTNVSENPVTERRFLIPRGRPLVTTTEQVVQAGSTGRKSNSWPFVGSGLPAGVARQAASWLT